MFYPAIYSDKSTLLESPATTALLIVILLLQPLVHADSLPHGKALIAGALLGLAMTIKIWGVVTLLIVLGWLLLLRRYGVALRVLIASAAAATVICSSNTWPCSVYGGRRVCSKASTKPMSRYLSKSSGRFERVQLFLYVGSRIRNEPVPEEKTVLG